MRLSDLLRQAGIETGSGSAATRDDDIRSVTHDSAQVGPGSLFCALPGRQTHGARFALDACERGALAILTDQQGLDLLRGRSDVRCPVYVHSDVRAAMARVAAVCYGNPAEQMTMLGVTGTNGKTTVSFLVQAALRAVGRSCGIIGTLGSSLDDEPLASSARTTPESSDLQRTLAHMAADGADAVAMEVSSIAVREKRVEGIDFDVMGFTGLSHDHLDYHGTMEEYFEAKAELFEPDHSRVGVVVTDGLWGQELVQRAGIPIITVTTTGQEANWSVRPDGGHWIVDGPESARIQVTVATDFAVANAALAIAMVHAVGVPAQEAADAVVSARVPGRMETVASILGIDFIVDYAHSPDSIEQVVQAAARESSRRNGRVIVVLGAGGDRDQQKRGAMGLSASDADVIVITDDNPRSEDPATIRAMVRRGVAEAGSQVVEISSRSDAIAYAVDVAESGDIVLVLGKGHETTQEVAGRFYSFDDREVLASFVRNRFGATHGEQGGDA